MAKLRRYGSLIPSPPFDLGSLMMFQFMSWYLFDLEKPPCQINIVIARDISDLIFPGAKYMESWKIGRAERTNLMSTTLPTGLS
jgi:hypothetical protein